MAADPRSVPIASIAFDAWRWLDAIGARPAVARGMAVASDARTEKMDDEARKHLFGQR